jgi:UMF1 family MFS transporter
VAEGGAAEPNRAGASPRALFAWCLFDWANSGFPTVISTFVFSAYFTKAVAASEIEGTAYWGWAASLSGLAIALASPVLGAVADRTGRRKPWIVTFSVLCIAATAALWFTKPDPAYVLLGLAAFAVANFAFETSGVFYNAMLPDLAPPSKIGRISGWGWGLGYMGGLSCLAIALFALVQPEHPPLGLDKGQAEHVRATALLVAAWYGVFILPFLALTPDRGATGAGFLTAVREGWRTLAGTVRRIRSHGNIVRYLIAHMVYTDGLNTLFAFGGIYAAGTFGMSFEELILFGIALNVTAGGGAAAFAWIDDAIGPKRTILIALAGLAVLGFLLLIVEGKLWFWVFALPLGLFMGPAQSASRSLMARLAPEHLRAEMFGLHALAGKATAFLGPAILGWATVTWDSQRAGMATVLVFFLAGAVLLLPVRDRGV